MPLSVIWNAAIHLTPCGAPISHMENAAISAGASLLWTRLRNNKKRKWMRQRNNRLLKASQLDTMWACCIIISVFLLMVSLKLFKNSMFGACLTVPDLFIMLYFYDDGLAKGKLYLSQANSDDFCLFFPHLTSQQIYAKPLQVYISLRQHLRLHSP